MDLFHAIYQRKACREYLDEPFSQEELAEVEAVIKGFDALFPKVTLDYRFIKKTKGMFHVEAPQYLVISGSGKEGEQENAGFIGEQFILWLNTRGFGATWLGASKDADKNQKHKDIIVIAFGKVKGSPNRKLSEFKRKDISEITNVPEDKGVQAMHLAPSGMNLQPWYFEKKADKILIYRQIIKPPMSFVYKLTKVDIGIALCHYALAARHYGVDFTFQLGGSAEKIKGYNYYGYVDLID